MSTQTRADILTINADGSCQGLVCLGYEGAEQGRCAEEEEDAVHLTTIFSVKGQYQVTRSEQTRAGTLIIGARAVLSIGRRASGRRYPFAVRAGRDVACRIGCPSGVLKDPVK